MKNRFNRKRTLALVLLFCLVFVVSFNSFGNHKSFREAEVKSVFLFNLTKFISWPETQWNKDREVFSIGILGIHPFEYHLEQVVKDESIKGRNIEFAYLNSVDEVDWSGLDMLYIGHDFYYLLTTMLKQTDKYKILTVGDKDGFCQMGGMINLLTVKERVRIEVNVDLARKTGFQVSLQLLKLARIVFSEKREIAPVISH